MRAAAILAFTSVALVSASPLMGVSGMPASADNAVSSGSAAPVTGSGGHGAAG